MESTYTAYKLNADKTLSHKEILNTGLEVEEWLEGRKFNYVVIVQDTTGKAKRGYRQGEGQYDWTKYSLI